MMDFMIQISVMLHVICMAGLIIFGCHRLWLLVCWRGKSYTPHAGPVSEDAASLVTIQLPLYNESRVAVRLIDAAAKIDWPESCLEIQILDDSTDETRRIAEDRAAFWAGRGHSIRVVHRSSRKGYKAGALSNGLRYAKGEFIAIFDADFIPPSDFLKKTIPYFSSPDIGMVQTRWKFLNAGYSWLTRLQEIFLSSHFRIEQYVRFHRRLFLILTAPRACGGGPRSNPRAAGNPIRSPKTSTSVTALNLPDGDLSIWIPSPLPRNFRSP